MVILMAMLHAQFAVAHYFCGSWFVTPFIISISMIQVVHLFLISAAAATLKTKGK